MADSEDATRIEIESAEPESEARARWLTEHATFERVVDITADIEDATTAAGVAERAECSVSAAERALDTLVGLRVLDRARTDPATYRRNPAYDRWRRIDALVADHTRAELDERVDDLLDEDAALREQFDAPGPDAVSPALAAETDADVVRENQAALARWRALRDDLELAQAAAYRAAREHVDD